MTAKTIDVFSCHCGGEDEGHGEPPVCWLCGDKMRYSRTRTITHGSTRLQGAAADKRTENGGY